MLWLFGQAQCVIERLNERENPKFEAARARRYRVVRVHGAPLLGRRLRLGFLRRFSDAGVHMTAPPAVCSILGPPARFAILCVVLLGAAGSGVAQDAARRMETPPEEVVVQATRLADEQITQQAQKAISDDPWIYGEHLTVTTQNGVIRVEGIVQDTWEWFRIIDRCRRIRGARRIDTSGLEMLHNDPDGG